MSNEKLLVFSNYGEIKSDSNIEKRLENIETRLNSIEDNLVSIQDKITKLFESTKSLVQYFNSVHERDIREFNYKLRSYATKQTPPINFFPTKGDLI